MQRASLVSLLAVSVIALALAGCTSPQPVTAPEDGGTSGTGDAGFDAGGNLTAGNTTVAGNATGSGNVTYGSGAGNDTGNGTEGNVTGNVTQGDTTQGNVTVHDTELYDADATYTGVAPPDATFEVQAPFSRLQANVTNGGLLLVGAKVTLFDPEGARTVLYDGSGDAKLTELTAPAPGTWTLRFEGNGSGALHVTVRGLA